MRFFADLSCGTGIFWLGVVFGIVFGYDDPGIVKLIIATLISIGLIIQGLLVQRAVRKHGAA